jgi:hypothetical protein
MTTFNSALWNSTIWGGNSGSTGGARPLTAGRLIYDAYRALGVLRPGQLTSPEGMDDAFGILNDMVDSWNTESLMVPATQRNVYPLTAGVCSYTLGPGGTLAGDRPQRVVSAALVSCGCGCGCGAGCTDLTLLASYTDCGCDCGIYIDNSYPDVNIKINRAPQQDQGLALQTWQQLSGFADLDTAYGFAPGYALAMRWNLALQLAPLALIMMKIPQNLLQQIEAQAVQAKAAVKSIHSSPPPVMKTDLGLGRYDICSDSYC